MRARFVDRPEVTNRHREVDPVLDLRLETFDYQSRCILKDISFTVRKRETLVLTGPSGIGKTTLLRIIAGLQGGYRGTIRAPEQTAMVFQEPILLPWRTVIDNICVTTGVSQNVAARYLQEVKLDGRGDAYPNQLSLGQQRRLSLARAFASQPELLLMDEPFVSLDPALVDEMTDLFRQLRDAHGVATVFVTHSEDEALSLATKIVRLDGQPATIVDERQIDNAAS